MAAQGTGQLRDRRALVTGSTHGAGAAIAQQLRREGADVWTTARRMPDDHPDPQRFIAADLTTAEGTSAVADEVTSARRPRNSPAPCPAIPPPLLVVA